MKGRFMIVRDYGSKLLLLLVFSMVGILVGGINLS